jgi:tetratricopeptide (TPR) repeat protein
MISICVLASVFCRAQDYTADYTAADGFMRAAPAETGVSARSIADYIARRFKSDDDRLRAAYVWIAENIAFDVDNLHVAAAYTSESEVVEKTLRERKAVCAGYMMLFKAVAAAMGLKVQSVDGYVREKEEISDYGHTWGAIQRGNEWLLVDPTWGAGYVSKGKFYREFDPKWFLKPPKAFARTHVPFDPVWQFSSYPVNNREFAANRAADSSASRYFNYRDSIRALEKLPEEKRIETETRRILSMGAELRVVKKRIEANKRRVDQIHYNRNVGEYNRAVDIFRQATDRYNASKGDRNDFEAIRRKLREAEAVLDGMRALTAASSANVENMRASIRALESNMDRFSRFNDSRAVFNSAVTKFNRAVTDYNRIIANRSSVDADFNGVRADLAEVLRQLDEIAGDKSFADDAAGIRASARKMESDIRTSLEYRGNTDTYNRAAALYNSALELYRRGNSAEIQTKLREASALLSKIRSSDGDMMRSVGELSGLVKNLQSKTKQ